MMWTITFVVLGAAAVVAASFSSPLEQWAPLLALWVAGGAHMAWIVHREAKETPRETPHRRAA